MTIDEQIAALEAEAAAAEERAKAATPTGAEKRMAEARDRARSARETEAAGLAVKRANMMALHVKAAEAKANGAYLVAGVDVASMFPIGKAPPEDQMPNKGFVVVRDAAEEEGGLLTNVEHKNAIDAKPLAGVLLDIACKSTVDPDPASAEGALCGGFYRRYPAAANQVAGEARRLGGAKVREAKRGSE